MLHATILSQSEATAQQKSPTGIWKRAPEGLSDRENQDSLF